jgi:transcriptional regulator with GAF, ATPase, and Fis domain
MTDDLSHESLFSDPKRLLLDMAQEHGTSELLRLIVTRLSGSHRVALARIWLTRPTADCPGCPTAEACAAQTRCLELVASGGRSVVDAGAEWTRLDGAFRRIPLGARKVGRIAAAGEPIEEPDLADPLPDWVARPDWVRAEGIRGFAGQPLVHRGEVLGVLAVFARGAIGADCMGWLRMIADHAAAALATARAFERIEELRAKLELENEYLREEVTRAGAFGELVGQGPALEAVARQIDLVASTDAAVLLLGESGTGKELVAREVHRRSKRSGRPLVKVNCAAVPRELYESEFFGHARGAFTGALRDRAGRFELADSGTLFLDEVGEIPLELQAKLLRVLQEGELERVGEERTRKVDVRLIAATNRDLRAEAEAGRFRQDLYYRLSVFPVELPPLRKRVEDIPLLAEHFLALAARKLGRVKPRLTLANVQQLQRYHWPGNVRELQHVIERAVITADGARLAIELPAGPAAPSGKTAPSPVPVAADQVLTDAEVRRLEADNIRRALRRTKGKVSGTGGAAELLALKPTTLASRIKALGLSPPSDESVGPQA